MDDKYILIIHNHEYNLKNLKITNDMHFLKINGGEKSLIDQCNHIPLIETLSISNNLIKRHALEKLVKREVQKSDKIIIFGSQDYLSFYAYSEAFKCGKEVSIVPDNIDFFIRPHLFRSKFTLKRLIKAIVFGLSIKDLNRTYSFLDNRIIYKILNTNDITSQYAFFNVRQIENISNKKEIVFISQPYYIDYGISEDVWISQLVETLQKIKNNNDVIFVKYHQRDTENIKQEMNIRGYKEYKGNVEDAEFIYGLFSTYLFELSLKGQKVYSLFAYMEELFPKSYIRYVGYISKSLDVNIYGENSWKISPQTIRTLI